jgi:hypothetical protein
MQQRLLLVTAGICTHRLGHIPIVAAQGYWRHQWRARNEQLTSDDALAQSDVECLLVRPANLRNDPKQSFDPPQVLCPSHSRCCEVARGFAALGQVDVTWLA